MTNNYTYNNLPNDISRWKNFPFYLNQNLILSQYHYTNKIGWLLYGYDLDKRKLIDYQHQLSSAIIVMNSWNINNYKIVHICGSITLFSSILADSFGLDIAPLNNIPDLKKTGLLIMDMDSTAIQIECIDEIAKLAGVGELVRKITEKAMHGKIDFSFSLLERVAVLKNTKIDILKEVRDNLPLTPGLLFLVKKLQLLNWKIVLASGGFTYYAEYLRDKLNLTAIYANELEINNGMLTGNLIGPIIDAQYKADILKKISKYFNISQKQTVAVGDGANDILMMKKSALSIAYNAKYQVKNQAKVSIKHADLMGVFCILSSTLTK